MDHESKGESEKSSTTPAVVVGRNDKKAPIHPQTRTAIPENLIIKLLSALISGCCLPTFPCQKKISGAAEKRRRRKLAFDFEVLCEKLAESPRSRQSVRAPILRKTPA
jgi:hypothetical protein